MARPGAGCRRHRPLRFTREATAALKCRFRESGISLRRSGLNRGTLSSLEDGGHRCCPSEHTPGVSLPGRCTSASASHCGPRAGQNPLSAAACASSPLAEGTLRLRTRRTSPRPAGCATRTQLPGVPGKPGGSRCRARQSSSSRRSASAAGCPCTPPRRRLSGCPHRAMLPAHPGGSRRLR